ncbi:hypothetical protein V2J09_017967 [Rumex salicifolius]
MQEYCCGEGHCKASMFVLLKFLRRLRIDAIHGLKKPSLIASCNGTNNNDMILAFRTVSVDELNNIKCCEIPLYFDKRQSN